MARRDENGLYDLDTVSSSVDTLSDHDPQGASGGNMPEMSQQFENPGHTHDVIRILPSIESIMSSTAMFETGTPEKTGNLTIDGTQQGLYVPQA